MPRNRFGTVAVTVGSSVVMAMAMSILPLPPLLFRLNPDWTLLFVIYWCTTIPDRAGFGFAWFVGLFADAITGRLLGQHALSYTLAAYACVRMNRQFGLHPLPQQMLWILGVSLQSQILILWTEPAKNSSHIDLTYWISSFAAALAWPLVTVVLDEIRFRLRIA